MLLNLFHLRLIRKLMGMNGYYRAKLYEQPLLDRDTHSWQNF